MTASLPTSLPPPPPAAPAVPPPRASAAPSNDCRVPAPSAAVPADSWCHWTFSAWPACSGTRSWSAPRSDPVRRWAAGDASRSSSDSRWTRAVEEREGRGEGGECYTHCCLWCKRKGKRGQSTHLQSRQLRATKCCAGSLILGHTSGTTTCSAIHIGLVAAGAARRCAWRCRLLGFSRSRTCERGTKIERGREREWIREKGHKNSMAHIMATTWLPGPALNLPWTLVCLDRWWENGE